MADSFPSSYVDPKTGEVKTLGTMWDKIESDGLLKGADYALALGKMAILAPAVGALAVVVPAAVWIAKSLQYKGLFNQVYESSLDETKYGGEQYDMTTPEGKQKFDDHFGHVQPVFPDDYLKMVKTAGLKSVPTIIVRDDMFSGWGPFKSPSEYNAGAASRTDGGKASIEIGQGVIDQMTPGELRAIIGHEITHLALGHTKDRFSWLARRPVNTMLNVGLLAAAAFGLVPFLPIAALVGVSFLTEKCLESINSRRREELCDRGAAILCGGTNDLASGLRKLKDINKKMVDQQLKQANQMSILFGSKAKFKIKEESALHRFFHASHPKTERRAQLLQKFEDKYHSFCEKQRSQFANTFNFRAKKPGPAKPSAHDILSQIFGQGGISLGDLGSIATGGSLGGGGGKKPRHVVIVMHPKGQRPGAPF